jgi:MFS transporter, CP family, cyanate transporter
MLPTGHGNLTRAALVKLTLLWLAGGDLRMTMLALPPVLPLIHQDLQLNEMAVGALSGLPVLLLGLAAIPGSRLIVGIGARRAVIGGLLLIAATSALRGLGPSQPMLFAMTFLMGVGIAVIQPALPSLVAAWFPNSPRLATAVYANGLISAEIGSASLTIPLVLPLVHDSWPLSFLVWSMPVFATAILISILTPQERRNNTAAKGAWWPNWGDAKLWQIGLLQGGSGTMYFGANAFIPDYLTNVGRGDLVGLCLALLNVGQLPASFLLVLFPGRLVGRKGPIIAIAVGAFLGLACILTPLTWSLVLGAAIIGFSGGFMLISALALPPLLASPEHVHSLSAGMFAIGYTMSFIVPLIGGRVWDLTNSPAMAFIPVAVAALVVLAMTLTLPSVRRSGRTDLG